MEQSSLKEHLLQITNVSREKNKFVSNSLYTVQLALPRVAYNSRGNGSAMRASAIGWFFETLEEPERVAIFNKILNAVRKQTCYGSLKHD